MDVTYEPGKTGNLIDQLDRHMKATEKELTAARAANALLALQLEAARRWSCAWKESAKVWRETAKSLDAELAVRREMEMEEQEVRS